jgi:hypothetical protein
VSNSERATNFHLGAILRPGSQKSSNDAFLISVTAKRVIEDREKGLNSKLATKFLILLRKGVVPEAG